MYKSILLAGLLSTPVALACGASTGITTNELKSSWRLQNYSCPKGCSDLLHSVLKNQLGEVIYFSGEIPWRSGTSDPCIRLISVKSKIMNSTDLLGEINQGQAQNRKLTLSELNMTSPQVPVHDVICTGQEAQRLSFRFIRNSARQLTVIDEETSVLVYE